MVTARVTSASDRRSSGSTATTGVSSPSRPSSTSCMITVAVQTLVMEPIWNSESAVVGASVRRLSTPCAATTSSSGSALAEPQDAQLGTRHVVLRGQGGQPTPASARRRWAAPMRAACCRSWCAPFLCLAGSAWRGEVTGGGLSMVGGGLDEAADLAVRQHERPDRAARVVAAARRRVVRVDRLQHLDRGRRGGARPCAGWRPAGRACRDAAARTGPRAQCRTPRCARGT